MDTQAATGSEAAGVSAEKKRDAGVYLLLYRNEGELKFGQFATKREASTAYSTIVEKLGPAAVEGFFKQAKPVQVSTKTVATF